MLYVVLGFHKSGTTLVSRILHVSGVHMGEFAKNGNYDNGNHYEDLEFLQINNSLLDDTWSSSLKIPFKVTSNKQTRIEQINNLVSLVSAREKDHEDFGLKDPRACLTYSLIRDYLPRHKIIGVYRNPYQLLSHYHSSFSLNRVKVLYNWCVYNSNLCNYLRSVPQEQYLLLNYEELMDMKELNDLEKFVDRKVNDVRDQKLFRNRDGRRKPLLIDELALLIFYGVSIRKVFDRLMSWKK